MLDEDYVKDKYNGNKNSRLEDITDVEDKDFSDVCEEEKEEVKVEEIIPIVK